MLTIERDSNDVDDHKRCVFSALIVLITTHIRADMKTRYVDA